MPDAVLIVEVPSLTVLFANRYAHTITESRLGRVANLDLNEVVGEVLHPDGRLLERADWPIMRAIRGEKVADQECVYRLEDGSSLHLRVSSAPSSTPRAPSSPRSPSGATSRSRKPAIPLALKAAYSRSRP